MYLDLTDDGLSKTLFYRGVHEPQVTQWLEEELAPGMTVLEVGANLGYYLLLAATRVGPRGKIYAVEPVPETFAILRKNIELNRLPNVVAECVALGSTTGEARMLTTGKRNRAQLCHPNLESARARAARGQLTQTITVPTRTLDRFVEDHQIENLSLVRMDVEGYETEVIRGGHRTLSAQRPMVLMEMHPFFAADLAPFADMVSFLYDAGLRVKWAGHRQDIELSWPDRGAVIDYLARGGFREAPHLLFVRQ